MVICSLGAHSDIMQLRFLKRSAFLGPRCEARATSERHCKASVLDEWTSMTSGLVQCIQSSHHIERTQKRVLVHFRLLAWLLLDQPENVPVPFDTNDKNLRIQGIWTVENVHLMTNL